jgi:LPS export ABC transporter protein LptC
VARALLLADTTFFFEDNTRAELEHVHTTFFTTSGTKSAVLTARHGTYRTQTGMMTARGDVVVISEDGRQLRSEELKYDQAHNEVSSDSAFVLTEPDRRMEGIGFRSDPNLKNVQVLKVLSGTSGPVTIPKQ